MKIAEQRLLTLSSTIVALVSLLGAANAMSTVTSNGTVRLAQSRQMYDYNYNSPATLGVRPGCYLPTDGCLNEDTVQN
jgi:hypothetical protein